MNNGWIKLYRKLRDNLFWKLKPFSKGQAWVDLLLRANHKEDRVMIGSQVINVLPGQILTSEKHLSEDWGWSRQKVRHFEGTLLVNRQICTPEKTSKYTLLTLTEWGKHQDPNEEKDIGKDIKKTSKRHQKDTYKNVKNGKNDKNNTSYQKETIYFDLKLKIWVNLLPEDFDMWESAYPACNIEIELKQMGQWLLSNPDKRKKNYRRFITNWLTRSQERGGTKGLANSEKVPEAIPKTDEEIIAYQKEKSGWSAKEQIMEAEGRQKEELK